MVERARLLIEYIVNYIEGSNPSHSDFIFKNFTYHILHLRLDNKKAIIFLVNLFLLCDFVSGN